MPINAVLNIVVPIALGALIGYFTNDLAIRMLFRPRKAVFIGKWQLPFTPGIIPKNQGRIAGAVAAAVSGQLFTAEDLVAQLKGSAAKEEIAGKLADAIFSPDLTIRSLTAMAAPGEEDGPGEADPVPADAQDTPDVPDPALLDATVSGDEDPAPPKGVSLALMAGDREYRRTQVLPGEDGNWTSVFEGVPRSLGGEVVEWTLALEGADDYEQRVNGQDIYLTYIVPPAEEEESAGE